MAWENFYADFETMPEHAEWCRHDFWCQVAIAALLATLDDLFRHIEDGDLVRNIDRDAEPGGALRQVPLVLHLAAASRILVRGRTPAV